MRKTEDKSKGNKNEGKYGKKDKRKYKGHKEKEGMVPIMGPSLTGCRLWRCQSMLYPRKHRTRVGETGMKDQRIRTKSKAVNTVKLDRLD